MRRWLRASRSLAAVATTTTAAVAVPVAPRRAAAARAAQAAEAAGPVVPREDRAERLVVLVAWQVERPAVQQVVVAPRAVQRVRQVLPPAVSQERSRRTVYLQTTAALLRSTEELPDIGER